MTKTTTIIPTNCPICDTLLLLVPGIGHCCPNRNCDMLDGPFDGSEPIDLTPTVQPELTQVLDERWMVDAIECIFGSEDISNIEYADPVEGEYELVLVLKRGKRIT